MDEKSTGMGLEGRQAPLWRKNKQGGYVRRMADPTGISVECQNESSCSSTSQSWNGNNVLGGDGETTKGIEAMMWSARPGEKAIYVLK